MANIEKAIEIEKEYIENKLSGKYPFHLVDKIRECGFKNLDEYLAVKKKYQFNQLEFSVIETTTESAISDVLNAISEKKTVVIFADTESTIVWNGNGSEFNINYCESNNIPVLSIQTIGGTIVSTKGDLNIGICVPKNIGIDANFILRNLVHVFKKYTDKTVEINGNDIIIGNHKVLGSSIYDMDNMFMFITPISMTEKSDLINNICLKKSNKTPSYIDFMTNNELRQEVLKWLKINSI